MNIKTIVVLWIICIIGLIISSISFYYAIKPIYKNWKKENKSLKSHFMPWYSISSITMITFIVVEIEDLLKMINHGENEYDMSASIKYQEYLVGVPLLVREGEYKDER